MPQTATTTVLYVVQMGDTLSKLAAKFYGNALNYPAIADANNLDASDILPIGLKLRIPNVPNSNAGASDDLSPIAVSATRLPVPVADMGTMVVAKSWLTDWRILLGGGLIAAALLYYLFSDKKR